VVGRRNGIGSQLGCVLGIGVAVSPVEALAGAWTLDPGTGQVVVTATASFTAYTGRNALQENGIVLGSWFKF
jgi:hypothetical protein